VATDYALVKSEIARFIGTPEASWSTAESTDVESSIRRGIESVVHNAHQWSWMRPRHEFSTSDGQRRYELPLDFEQFITSICFDGDNHQYDEITQLPAGRLTQMYAEYPNTGVPTNYALEVEAHDGATEQKQVLVLHPTPDGTYPLAAYYQVGPIRGMDDSRPYFPGGPENRELFIAACVAAAEDEFKDETGQKAERFQGILAAAIRRDHHRQARNLGQLGGRRPKGRDYYRWKLQTQANGQIDS